MLVPYVEINGARVLPDNLLVETWERAIKQGLCRKLFGQDKTADEFLAMMKSRYNLPVFIFIKNNVVPLGFAWLNTLNQSYALAHFLFLKESWGQYTEDMGRTLCKYWFSLGDPPLFKVLIGNIPSENRAAIRFVERIGWKVVGEIPHMAFNGRMTITYITRESL